MSEELRHQSPRFLGDHEKKILIRLIELSSRDVSKQVEDLTVKDMDDGAMGGLRFSPEDEASVFGECIVEAEYIDSDGIPVSICLNLDKDGRIFEIDFWKIDFSPLRTYPSPQDVVIKKS